MSVWLSARNVFERNYEGECGACPHERFTSGTSRSCLRPAMSAVGRLTVAEILDILCRKANWLPLGVVVVLTFLDEGMRSVLCIGIGTERLGDQDKARLAREALGGLGSSVLFHTRQDTDTSQNRKCLCTGLCVALY